MILLENVMAQSALHSLSFWFHSCLQFFVPSQECVRDLGMQYSLSLASTPWLWLLSARLHVATASITTVRGSEWKQIFPVITTHREHTLIPPTESTQLTNWQTSKQQANDALVQCMVKKYIYWNLCQCRKNLENWLRVLSQYHRWSAPAVDGELRPE